LPDFCSRTGKKNVKVCRYVQEFTQVAGGLGEELVELLAAVRQCRYSVIKCLTNMVRYSKVQLGRARRKIDMMFHRVCKARTCLLKKYNFNKIGSINCFF